ncbi:SGNH/GDSL hydrolase family protein [Amycolatopsis sp. NPDC059657]|uniref:SGNH/GDSL hydrolase family protein n=1 Tax=Amycolatopsis sp. NPDC059657 TaxID=3346899 RepID=UPI00366D41D6
MSYHRFVALGDSCTEGLDDPHPFNGQYRGWADFVAGRLALDETDFRYANLGVRGRRLDHMLFEQIPVAETMRPDVICLFGGANDVMAGVYDERTVARRVDAVYRAATSICQDVVVFTLPDVAARMPLGKRMRPRIEALNDAIRESAVSYGALLIDLWPDTAVNDSRYFGADRLHLSEPGHRRLAAYTLGKLGVSFPSSWLTEFDGTAPQPTFGENASWVCKRVLPLAARRVKNRLTGSEPGDGISPRRPELRPVLPSETAVPFHSFRPELFAA